MNLIERIAYETDVWLSVATGGQVDESVSYRVARACKAKQIHRNMLIELSGGKMPPMRRSCFVCWVLSALVEHDHCEKVLAGQTTQPWAATKAAMLFVVCIAIVALAVLLPLFLI